MARRSRGRSDETEMRPLLNDDGENDDADFEHTANTVLLTVGDNQENPSTTREIQYGTFTQAAGHSNGSVENMRFIVLGSDNNLMNKVPAFILGESQLVIDEKSNKELYLLDAIREAFGQEALDYSMVLFINECRHNQPNANHCVKACGKRYHILNGTNQSVADLFVKVERMIQNKKSKCFINNFEFFKKVSAHLHMEYKRKLTEMNKTVQNLQKKIRDLKTEVDLKDAMLQEESQKCKALEQKLTEAGVEQALLSRGQPRTAQRPEDEGETESREEDSQASGSQTFVRVRRSSKEIDPPNMPEHKDEREIESREEDSQASGSQTFVRVRRGSKEIDPPNMSQRKDERKGQASGSQTFERLKTLKEDSKKI
ncbi:uncharacterized protein LOC107731075 [Sinocyclocheilus rhinocerous]|uniref:uncharacterized protein LOC107731075 n=1 Tax=Sinocyclocheilus rhinocerous TaxID=307959 RepID=UPI0007BADB30|nr:PREDICTED: uncharacterized protein LOC107731075 [Sinocyclocheilus rhinocerous]